MSREKGFRLRTLGGLALLDRADEAPLATVQRKRLVLLSLLATAGRRGLSRDALLAYLWPDSDGERARQSLKQAVYSLRLAIGEEALLLGPTELRLDPAVLPSDVDDFEQALAAGAWERAVALYGGPFLDGVHLPDVPELERWIDQARQRLAAAHAGALEQLARRAAEGGSLAEAVQWWRRLAALEPASSHITLELMQALAAAGDAPAALQQARLHETLLRQEFDTTPDPAVLALVERLRASRRPQPEPDPTRRGAVGTSRTGGASESDDGAHGEHATPPAAARVEGVEPRSVPVAADADAGPTARRPPSHAHEGRPAKRLRPGRRGLALAAMLLALAVVGTVAMRAGAGGGAPAAGDPNMIVVLPFTVRGTGDLEFLTEGMVDLLGTNLNGAGELRTVNPRALLGFVESAWKGGGDERDRAAASARHFSGGRYVLGSVTGVGREVWLSADLYDVDRPDVVVARATARGSQEELFALVDTLTVQLLASLPGGPETRLARTAAVTTTSLAALKAYLTGESHFRRAQYAEAMEAFQTAVAHDSGFALANYRLSRAADHGDRIDLARPAAERAARDTGRLGAHDRLLVAAMAAQRRGAMDEAERIYRHVVSRSPTDVEAWYQLGEVLFHGNGPRGRSFLEARTAYERVLALTPQDRDAISHLARIAAAEGDRRLLDSLRALPSGQEDDDMHVLHAFTFGDRPERERVLAALDTANEQIVHNHCWRVAVYGRNMRDATRICRLLTDHRRLPEARALGHQRLAELAMAQGRRREAWEELAALSQLLPEWGAELTAFYTLVPLMPTDQAEVRAARDRLAQLDFEAAPPRASLHFAHFNGRHERVGRYLIGFLGTALDSTPGVEGAAPDSSENWFDRNVALSLAAYGKARRGDASSALALLDRTGGDRHTGDLWYGAIIHDRFLRAELLERLGRIDEAAAWYGSIGEPQVMDLAYAGQGAYMSARLHERRGRVREAVTHYQRFIALWERCDPEVRPLVDRARQRVQALSRHSAGEPASAVRR